MARRMITPAAEGRNVLAVVRLLATLAAVVGVLVAIFVYAFLAYTAISPQRIELPEHELVVDESGRKVTFGESSLARRGRLWVLSLRGSPEEMGAAQGRLLARQFAALDERVLDLVARRYPSWTEAWAEGSRLRWQYRGATRALRSSEQRELAALARSLPTQNGRGISLYHRLFLHQCFFEIVQRIDDVVIDGVAFAQVPRANARTPDLGNMVVGRAFSVDLGAEFETERIVAFHYPDGKYPFVSVSWAGQVGVVTGVNSRGLVIAVNPARTDDPSDEGLELPILARQVLEEADSLDTAVEILLKENTRTAGAVLVADGVARQAVVIEMGPRARDRDRVRRGDGESVLWVTDHLIREPFETDASNDRIRRTTSSGQRFQRLKELLAPGASLTPKRAVEILRDRRGLEGTEIGLGNRNALETLGLTQAVVVDATAMVLWVSEGPSALGRFRAFDLRHLLAREGERPAPLDDLPADRLLYSEEYNDWLEAQKELAHARSLLSQGHPQEALAAARIALALAPAVGDLHRLLGDIERDLGNIEQARIHYERYLELVPGRLRDQEVVRGILQELEHAPE